MTDEETIRKIIEECASMQDGKAAGRAHMHDDCLFIRPTGNPLTMTMWDDMMNSPDVQMKSSKLVKISKVVVEGNMAYAVYVSHAVFCYKGTDNDDVAVFSAVFQKGADATWKMVHGHRSTGRGPNEALPAEL